MVYTQWKKQVLIEKGNYSKNVTNMKADKVREELQKMHNFREKVG